MRRQYASRSLDLADLHADPFLQFDLWMREAIETEYRRTVTLIGRVTGRAHLLDGATDLQRSVALRNPYVDSLSELQVRLLGRLRSLAPEDPERERVVRLVQLTVNGVAAGLQNTG